MSASTPLGPGREFDLIQQLLAQDAGFRRTPGHGAAILLGPGDDCAVIAAPAVALSVDLSIEDVHFRRAWIEPEAIGWRAAAAALSDLAAVAAQPIGVLVSVAATPTDAESVVPRIMAGVSEAAAAQGAALLGGDVSRSPGPLILDIVVAGSVTRAARRSGARPGDGLWVTGRLGGAAAAVHAWEADRQPDPAGVAAFARPRPRIAEAIWLAEQGVVHALIDVSDGLAGDAGHLAAASGVQVVLDPTRIPVHPTAAATGRATGNAWMGIAGLPWALGGGEDYELCFAGPIEAVELLRDRFVDRFAVALTRVGDVRPGQGVRALDASGALHEIDIAGYSHL